MLAYFCRAAAGCFSWAGLLEKREAKKKSSTSFLYILKGKMTQVQGDGWLLHFGKVFKMRNGVNFLSTFARWL